MSEFSRTGHWVSHARCSWEAFAGKMGNNAQSLCSIEDLKVRIQTVDNVFFPPLPGFTLFVVYIWTVSTSVSDNTVRVIVRRQTRYVTLPRHVPKRPETNSLRLDKQAISEFTPLLDNCLRYFHVPFLVTSYTHDNNGLICHYNYSRQHTHALPHPIRRNGRMGLHNP